MNARYPVVPLSEVLCHYQEYIDAPEARIYPKLSVKLYGKGVVLDTPADGSTLKMQRHQIARSGQVILSEIWGKKGAIGFVPSEGNGALCTSHFFLFDVNYDRIDPRYLQGIFTANYLQDQLDAEAKGTTGYAAVRPKYLLAATIPLPTLVEQRRIVARVEELAAKIEEARGLRREAMDEARSLINAEIATIFATGRKKGWPIRKLDDYVIDDCYGTSEKTIDDTEGTPILRMGNIQNGKLDFHDLKYLYLSERDRKRLLLSGGDILVNRTNSAELVGKCAVFDRDDEFSFASYIIRLRLDLEKADPYLVASYINSPSGRAYMFSERKQMTGQANVNATILKALPLSLPLLAEQQCIVAYLDSLQTKVDALKTLQAETQVELDALLPSVLDKAFKGDL
jgi:type I restriction enzyme, S subunit